MEETPKFSQEWVNYFIPSTVRWDHTGFPDLTDAVMKNRIDVSLEQPFGITDAGVLDDVEGWVTYKNFSEIMANPVPGNYDLPHLQKFHHLLFRQIYPWAGKLRNAPRDWPMGKMGPDIRAYHRGNPNPPEIQHRYLPANEIAHYGKVVLDRLAAKNFLRGLDRDTFVDELTKCWARTNMVHVFREGNTRAQTAFFRQLSADAGYTLDTERFRPVETEVTRENPGIGDLRDMFVWGRFEYMQTGELTLLREALDAAVVATPTTDPTQVGMDHAYDLSALRAVSSGHPRSVGRLLTGESESDNAASLPTQPENSRSLDSGYER
ncbi:UNVERIFIED_ORG: cell filamentation protein [Nocardia globerula]|uniref:protein adenylyltransferase n=1 Tax=Nocardia globerula TaxID=1818 RepID=A0A652YIU0_NOCGL